MALAFVMSSLGIASALAMAALGIASLLGGRSRPRGALAFGAFAILWGTQVALAHGANLVLTESMYRLLMLLLLACLIVIPYFLVEFVTAQLGSDRRIVRVWRWATLGIAMVAALVFIVSPEVLFEGVVRGSRGFFPRWGSLHALLVSGPFFLAFAFALFGLAVARRAAPTPRVGRRIAILLAGLGIYVGFAAGNNLVYYALDALQGGPATDYAFLAIFLAMTIVALGVAWRAGRGAKDALDGADRREQALVAIAIAVPFVLGAAEALWVSTSKNAAVSAFETVGLWRLLGVGVLAYGIARWRTFDLPQRARGAAATATGATAAAATGAAAYGAGTLAASSAAVPALAGLVVLAAALIPAVSFARRLFGVQRDPTRGDLAGALYGQRIDAYRAALEASLARSTFEEDREFLAALRERFTISHDEDRLLTHLARSSVIVARDQHAWDAYERLRLLGEGGGGRTWLARDRARDRLVVLKEPLERWQQEPAAREAVLREARLAAKVRHPNVVAVEEVVEGNGSPVIVMEYLEGGSLAQLLRARGTLPWPEARTLMLDVLRGLEAVHAGGILHRDIKPSNILLTSEGVAKLADFGIAIGPAGSGPRTIIVDAAQSTLAGTLHYMAPEARAGAPPDRRMDVFGCAALLHEMLYGAPPGLPSPLVVRNDLPAGVAPLLSRALSPRPDERPATARALAEEIAKFG